jgi:flagellar basal-body rod protein FlgB
MSLLDSTQLALQSAMSGSMMRQSLLTNDLANAETPGYQPEDVNFQATLQSALAQGQDPTALTFTPYTQPQTNGPNGNGVDTELTNAQIAENGLLYQNLTQIAAARDTILQDAIHTTGA